MYIEAMSGAAGDMLLGALIDAGLPVDELRRALGTLGVGHEIRVSRVTRAGVSATHVQVVDTSTAVPAPVHAHTDRHGRTHVHAHAHADDAHRSLSDIRGLIGASALPDAGKARAIQLFERLGEVEASIHGVSVDDIHFHEVGAIDSIVDIVGCVFGMEWFGIDDVVSSPLNVGGGTVEIAHGTFPVPAPATVRLLMGAPVFSAGPRMELTTPTGALLVSGYARAYGPMPAMTVGAIGYGAGTRDIPGMPNVLRVVVGERTSMSPVVRGGAAGETVVQIECEIDDMNPQLFGPAADRLFEAGALDVFLTPVQMKKGRPGTLVTVLAPEDKRRDVTDVLFIHTTTIGVRLQRVERETLDRRWVEVSVTGGFVRIKVAERDGRVLNAAPEFDDCERIAASTGRPVKDVQVEAMTRWRETVE
jgi:uncharacterized protein (TIGR00299 family) protein